MHISSNPFNLLSSSPSLQYNFQSPFLQVGPSFSQQGQNSVYNPYFQMNSMQSQAIQSSYLQGITFLSQNGGFQTVPIQMFQSFPSQQQPSLQCQFIPEINRLQPSNLQFTSPYPQIQIGQQSTAQTFCQNQPMILCSLEMNQQYKFDFSQQQQNLSFQQIQMQQNPQCQNQQPEQQKKSQEQLLSPSYYQQHFTPVSLQKTTEFPQTSNNISSFEAVSPPQGEVHTHSTISIGTQNQGSLSLIEKNENNKRKRSRRRELSITVEKDQLNFTEQIKQLDNFESDGDKVNQIVIQLSQKGRQPENQLSEDSKSSPQELTTLIKENSAKKSDSIRLKNVKQPEKKIYQQIDKSLDAKHIEEKLKSSLLDSLDDDQKTVVRKAILINRQNINRNYIKAFKSFVIQKVKYIINYEKPSAAQYHFKSCQNLPLVVNNDPTDQERAVFNKKFNKFIASKQHSNNDIKQIIENRLYGYLFNHFLSFEAQEWVSTYLPEKQEEYYIVSQFYLLCLKNSSFLSFMNDSYSINKKYLFSQENDCIQQQRATSLSDSSTKPCIDLFLSKEPENCEYSISQIDQERKDESESNMNKREIEMVDNFSQSNYNKNNEQYRQEVMNVQYQELTKEPFLNTNLEKTLNGMESEIIEQKNGEDLAERGSNSEEEEPQQEN